jgi:hypothetical protein
VSVIPCSRDARLKAQIERFAEVLKTQAHQLGEHGLSEQEFYRSPIFRGAIERVRGEFSATLRGKREFVHHVLNHLWDGGFIAGWEPAKGAARNDYSVRLVSGRSSVIDLKGCLDGNNTNIFEQPADADEFVIWSLCTNVGADPRRNAWSGIHTRLSAEIISRQQPVDGVIIWDMVCGQPGRPCPKLAEMAQPTRRTAIGPFLAPPPCIYVLPHEPVSAEQPSGAAQPLAAVELLAAFHNAFGGRDNEINFVDFEVGEIGDETVRRTTVRRGGAVQHASEMTPIRRV